MMSLFQYDFIIRAFEAGIVVACIAPLIGVFLVLRRYSLIADTLAHVSLAGVALGLLMKLNPVATALCVTVLSSLGIERLRAAKIVYGESALALFLSGSLAIATILLSLGQGLNTSIFKYLFGSIVTVTQQDVIMIVSLGILVAVTIVLLYKELVYIAFDEESAKVSGIRVNTINTILIVLAACTITLALPVVGALLIAALIVIPAVAALQLRRSFIMTIVYAEAISLVSVIAGIVVAFYLDLAASGTIVLLLLVIFLAIMLGTRYHTII